ncbi:MAG: glycosyltransferase family 4 protein [Candidatus Omnitrophota bacterium]|nr:glycosyltransferase family 4 protein [Candidatus Omnitrophota bacterium]
MIENKNIAFISSQKIFNPGEGVERRVNYIFSFLSKKNNVVAFAPYQKLAKANKEYYGLNYKHRIFKILDPRIILQIIKLNRKDKFDIIYATTVWSGLNGLLSSLFNRAPLYFDEHNVEFLRFKRTSSTLWPIIYLYEWLVCRFAEKIISVSDTDKRFFIKYYGINPKKIEIFENQADKSIFCPNNKKNKKIRKELGINSNEKMILFYGQLNYEPNVEALEIIKNQIIPLLENKKKSYKLVICGRGDGRGLLINFKHTNLIFKGFVERIQDYINASDVVIAPLLSGSGTRIKILEALACKKRVISTSIGVEGLKRNKLLEVEDDWNKFVEKI